MLIAEHNGNLISRRKLLQGIGLTTFHGKGNTETFHQELYRESQFEQYLGKSDCRGSRIGINNGHLMNASEGSIGNFSFAYNPLLPIPDDVLLFANTPSICSFRYNNFTDLFEKDKLFAKRTEGRIQEGCEATVVIEVDSDESVYRIPYIVSCFAKAGVKNFIIGNETNDPNARWRDDMGRIYTAYKYSYVVLNALGYANARLFLPGMAYYGDGSYLGYMIHAFMQRANSDGLNPYTFINGVADHFYGAVSDLLPRVSHMRSIMSTYGIGDHMYCLTEIGNPAPDTMHDSATDRQIAEGYLIQVLSLATASNMVDNCTYYSLLDGGRPNYSLMSVEDNRLVAKDSYHAYVNITKLLSNLEQTNLVKDISMTVMYGKRTDGIEFFVMWSTDPEKVLRVPSNEGDCIYNALGEEQVIEEKQGAILLPPQKNYFAGPARIVILGRH